MEITEKIINMKRDPDNGGVFEVLYEISGTKQDLGSRRVKVVELTVDTEASNFIPFEDLTEEIVLGWARSKLGSDGIAEITAKMEAEIDQRLNPSFLSGNPW